MTERLSVLLVYAQISEKSEIGQTARFLDLKTVEKSIWGGDLLRYAQFHPNSPR